MIKSLGSYRYSGPLVACVFPLFHDVVQGHPSKLCVQPTGMHEHSLLVRMQLRLTRYDEEIRDIRVKTIKSK